MKKRGLLISIILILIILLSYCPSSFAAVTNNDNGKMKYYKKDYNFDIKGYVNGTLQSTTFYDGGYDAKLKVDDNDAEYMYLRGDNQEIDGVTYDITCSFINNGRYVKITYTLKNTENVSKKISLGGFADVQIAGDDKATVERFEGSKGLKLYNEEKNIQFSFYGKSVAGTTNIDNLWIGTYPNEDKNCFNSNTTNKIQNQDSAFAYSWVNRTLAANATNNYSVIIGIGEVSNAPKIELDETQGKCFSVDSVVIKGTIHDADKNSKATLYYSVDGGAEKTQAEAALTNNKLPFSIDLTSLNLKVGTHKLKLWAIDESGNPSEIMEKEFLVSNLKAPTLEMSEEWSKETVKFKITDTKNDAAEVAKYQYKIGNGEWQDIALNTEQVALDKTGTAVVTARAVGKQTDEYSSTVSKTAKVDKEAPTIAISAKDKKITITATDDKSGIASTKYVVTTKENLEGNEEFTQYNGPFDYTGNEKGTVYVHATSTDKLGNTKTAVKEYKPPVVAQIDTKEEFTTNPTYTIKDENNQGYTYQVKINNGEWITVNLNTTYTIDSPLEGNNTITTRTLDPLGRVSSETSKTTKYIIDNTKANGKLPQTGVSIIIPVSILALVIFGAISKFGYNKYRDIR